MELPFELGVFDGAKYRLKERTGLVARRDEVAAAQERLRLYFLGRRFFQKAPGELIVLEVAMA